LEYPQYTRPREFKGYRVPDVLFSGDHEKIRAWRRRQAMNRTLKRRPNLIREDRLSPDDLVVLKSLKIKK
jgi:tRNA (guanine37-N1)-methyltransferase